MPTVNVLGNATSDQNVSEAKVAPHSVVIRNRHVAQWECVGACHGHEV